MSYCDCNTTTRVCGRCKSVVSHVVGWRKMFLFWASVEKTNNRMCHVNTISVQFRFRCRSLFGLTTTLHHNSNMSEMRSGFNFGSFVHGEIIPQGPCPSCYQVTAKKENCLKDFDSLCYATNLSFICDRALCAVYLSWLSKISVKRFKGFQNLVISRNKIFISLPHKGMKTVVIPSGGAY